jgi:Domain of unknown function (DUF1905)/Bacteriocin-protection, YdeI or OmpD-Associated
MATPKAKSFTSVVGKFDSNLWYYHVPVTTTHAKPFINGEDRRVVVTINQTETFQAALMPDGKGHFFINLNKQIRTRLKLREGDEVRVQLDKDTSEYGLPIPEEFEELLQQDEEGGAFFHALTPGKQRTLLYLIAKPKSADLRIRNGLGVLEHLKRTNGVIHYKQLMVTIKEMGS